MNLKKLMNESLIANNGEISRGMKNKISLLNAFYNDDIDEKIEILNQYDISIYNYNGLRILEFSNTDIKEVLEENFEKLELYRNDLQELVRDLRKKEISLLGSSIDVELVGGLS